MTDAKRSGRVLIVEDSATQAKQLELLLQAEGFETVIASDGLEGVEAFRASSVDLVMCDVVMPQMSGFDFCEEIRAEAAELNVPIIFVTSLRDPLDIIKGLTAGASNYIIKPYEAAELIERVNAILTSKDLRKDAEGRNGDAIKLRGEEFALTADRGTILDYLVSTFEDLVRAKQKETASEQAAEALRESIRHLQATLDALPSHLAILDISGTIVLVNAEWRRFAAANTVITAHSHAGDDYLRACDVVSGANSETAATIAHGLREVIAGSTPSFSLEYVLKGTKPEVWLSMYASRFEAGEDQLVLLAQNDISQRKALEKQVQQAHKLEAIGQLAGGVAHDFNNLLTGITGYAQLIESAVDEDSAILDDLRQINECARRASTLTGQLLTFSRPQPLNIVPLDLNALVENTFTMLCRLIGESIEPRLVASPDSCNVRADAGQIDQVLMNLALNARDAMPDGGKLTIETTSVEIDEASARRLEGLAPGSYARLAVTDTGHGMDEETQRRMLDPFFTTKRATGRTGLGLTTVQGIVKQHDGILSVSSQLGSGTTFEIYLPQIEDGAQVVAATDIPGVGSRRI